MCTSLTQSRSLHFLHLILQANFTQNSNFLSDLKSYYAFKQGYVPTYKAGNLAAIGRQHNLLEQAVSQCPTPPEGGTPHGLPCNSPDPLSPDPPSPDPLSPDPLSPQTSLSALNQLSPSHPAPTLDFWILDSHLINEVKDLRFYVQIWEGLWADLNEDRVVCYTRFGNKVKVTVVPNLKKPSEVYPLDPSHICCPGKFKMSMVAQLPNNVQGLYLVVEGTHIGKLVCRVNHV
ncbi:hypothetical protein GYMLUDRAFT_64033 [Collybiopsis luxurians FD-317 M1]|uniref:Uncharacterized protein n=1 Tax=Collybiopsis luxurians FD-317 M1 TaxID=944289 RepID=A0A0D0CCU8_9AGAR|nr:hypothetical protein GYMLUDRAFT_64033 [Collybiopsis luxurians FD-317 M1]